MCVTLLFYYNYIILCYVMLCYVMLCYVIIIVLYCIYLASACLLNETIRINSLVHLSKIEMINLCFLHDSATQNNHYYYIVKIIINII